MKSIVIGTAGHIDHGKTALVKALTGIDADRLAEEKRRGITIDLGFAHMALPTPGGDTLQIGFVDVPGHERFVRNMLAGVGGIDLVLLVIAADEAIKPQTREHFDILQLLGVKRGITVLTKSDAVDAETLDVVRLEVEEFLRGTFLQPPPAPLIAVSSLTGAGLDELQRAIVTVAAEVEPRDWQALARLPIDRVFTMKGFGTIGTGTLISGTIRREDELEVFPGGRRVRVRGIQVHGESAERAVAGQRTALNLAGAATEELSRGMTLVPPATFRATRVADVQLQLLPSASRAVKNHARVHFHSYSMETVGEVVLRRNPDDDAQGARMSPGSEAFARIRLPEPVLLLPGDRFILRQFSPVVTIGGGVVVDAAPVRRDLPDPNTLATMAGPNRQAILRARIRRHDHNGAHLLDLVAETGWTKSAIERELSELVKARQVVRIKDVSLVLEAWEWLKQRFVPSLEQFHRESPGGGHQQD